MTLSGMTWSGGQPSRAATMAQSTQDNAFAAWMVPWLGRTAASTTWLPARLFIQGDCQALCDIVAGKRSFRQRPLRALQHPCDILHHVCHDYGMRPHANKYSGFPEARTREQMHWRPERPLHNATMCGGMTPLFSPGVSTWPWVKTVAFMARLTAVTGTHVVELASLWSSCGLPVYITQCVRRRCVWDLARKRAGKLNLSLLPKCWHACAPLWPHSMASGSNWPSAHDLSAHGSRNSVELKHTQTLCHYWTTLFGNAHMVVLPKRLA